MTDKFRLVTSGIITHRGKILLGKKEEDEEHPISGEWHFPGGYLEEDEEPDEAVKRKVSEKTGLNVVVHQLVDVTANTDTDSPFQIIYHLESDSDDVRSKEDLEEVKWVDAENIEDELGLTYTERIEEREELQKFIKRIKKAPY